MAQPADMPAESLLRSFRPKLGTDFWDCGFAGCDDSFDVLEIRAAASLRPAPEVPDALAAPEHDAREDLTHIRLFELSGLRHINGRKLDLSRINALVQAGATESWGSATPAEPCTTSNVDGARFAVQSRLARNRSSSTDVSSHESLVRR